MLCLAHKNQDRPDALEKHRISLRIRENKLGKNHPDTAMSLNNLGAALYSQQEYRESLERFGGAIAINSALYGEKHTQTLLTKLNMAINNMALSDYAAAEVWLRQIVEVQDVDSPLTPLQTTALVKFGDTQVALNNLADAQTHYLGVLNSVPPESRVSEKANLTQAYKGLAQIYARQGNTVLARALPKTYPWAKP